MLLPFKAFFGGLLRAALAPKAVLVLFAANLAFGFLIALPVAALLHGDAAISPGAAALLQRYDATFATDFLRAHRATFAASAALLDAGALLYLLSCTFLAGGILNAVTRRGDTFFGACGCWFWPFLRVLAPAAVVLVLLAATNDLASFALRWLFADVLDRGASAALLGWTLVAKTLVFAVLFALLVLAPVSFARIRSLLDGDRRMVRGYLGGIGLALRKPLTVLVFFALHAGVLVALLGAVQWLLARLPMDAPLHPLRAFGFAFDPALPPAAALVIVTQGAMLVAQWLVVARAAGLVLVAREHGRARETGSRDPELVYAGADVAPVRPPRQEPAPLAPTPVQKSNILPRRGYAVVDAEADTEAGDAR